MNLYLEKYKYIDFCNIFRFDFILTKNLKTLILELNEYPSLLYFKESSKIKNNKNMLFTNPVPCMVKLFCNTFNILYNKKKTNIKLFKKYNIQ
jgi:D-alanine-D-alanine ligase-like ATP-grasp enzyme